MAQRSDITVRWDLSPRLITIAAPSTEITIQDLHDTLRELEAQQQNLIYPSIIETAGKESLGGGVSVGLTATLQNACISFEARLTSITDGYATAFTPTGGTIFTDSNAMFITDGVERGGVIINFADFSAATVVQVISETQLEIEALKDGIVNNWEIGDYYKIWNQVTCNITGGNLVAVDINDISIDPVCPTAFVQVVRSSASSATSQNSLDIEFASFNGGVSVDITNYTGRATSGTIFPVGTIRQPCDNFVDALAIASLRGFDTFYIYGNTTIDSGLNFSSKRFVGESEARTTCVVSSAADVTGCEFENMTFGGTLDGYCTIRNCIVSDLIFFNGHIYKSGLTGTIELGGGVQASIVDCFDDIAGLGTPTINMGGAGQSLIMANYTGGATIENKTGAEEVSINMISGRIILDSTVVAGDIIIRGVGRLIDNSAGANVDSLDLLQGSVLNQQSAETKYLIEDLREHHSGVGVHYYWDPDNGSDSNNGLLPTTACKNFQYIHDNLVIDGNHDVIHLVSLDLGAGPVIYTGTLNITKHWVFLRGPGRDVLLQPSAPGPVININATGTQIFGLRIECVGYPNSNLIYVGPSSDFIELSSLWILNSTNNAIKIDGGGHHTIKNCEIHNSDGYGIQLTDGYHCSITNNTFHNCNKSIRIESNLNDSTLNILSGNIILSPANGSIEIGPGVTYNLIRANNFIDNNFPIVDDGTNTFIEKDLINTSSSTVTAQETLKKLFPFLYGSQ